MERNQVIKTIYLLIAVLGLLCWAPLAFAYYAPLQDVTAWVEGSTLRFKVYDPKLGQWQEGSKTLDGSATPTVHEGIVFCPPYVVSVYDPDREGWHSDSAGMSSSTTSTINDGVIITTTSLTAPSNSYAITYDPCSGWWKKTLFSFNETFEPQVLTKSGVAAGVSDGIDRFMIFHHINYMIYNTRYSIWHLSTTLVKSYGY